MGIALASFVIFFVALLEAVVLPLPLTLVACIFLGIFYRKSWVFFIAIIAGVFLDSLTFRLLGMSSLFFLVTIGLIFLYGRKFETQHILFLVSATTVGSLMYLLLFSQFSFVIFWKIVLIDILAGFVFAGIFLLQSRLKSASK